MHFIVAEEAAHNTLEEIDYDNKHGIDLPSIRASSKAWFNLIARHSRRHPRRVLELGAGTGFLTLGLNMGDCIEDLFSTDISAVFLRTAQERVEQYGAGVTRTHYFVANIEDLPFRNSAFDVIVANSVLHHIMDYGALLTRCADWLAEGGVAIFNEPVLQGKLVIALLLQIIADTDEAGGNRLSPNERQRLRDLVFLFTIDKVMRDRPDLRAKMEDKHIFDLDLLALNANAWGFSRFGSENTRAVRGAARSHADAMARIMGLDPKVLDPYQFVFDAYQDVVLDLIGPQTATAHRHLVFHK